MAEQINNIIHSEQPIVGEDPKAMRGQLDSSFNELKIKEGALNSKKLLNKNLLKEKRADLIKSMFGIMEEAGVDLSSMESISKFVSQLEQQNPDLAIMFEMAFSGLTGEKEQTQQETPEAGMMDKFKNLAPQVMMGQ